MSKRYSTPNVRRESEEQGTKGRSQEPCMPSSWLVLLLMMRIRSELKQIRNGAGMNAPNAPTLAEMEVEI
ncbi:unnamed protein product [Sphagnum compactum]